MAYSHMFHLGGEGGEGGGEIFQKEFHLTDQSEWKNSDKPSWT